ncbi:helix-turn-helix domain-containing protein [Streptomyces peucetius]|uniref:Helix-turn-helix domain-containing protein n=1 Tax=Streptomyces peucetius TaxID=1950 RepID=A0ABY6II16_STRPE|nr:helix-turn-helix domain-containing protein [Streptomyces peucetius]UYQ66689.1 helix-turn-helix domain-containing protein [Streptomyces peucetius]
MYPMPQQARQMLLHCAHARYVWNLAVEQHANWRKGRKAAPGFAEQCRQLTEARRDSGPALRPDDLVHQLGPLQPIRVLEELRRLPVELSTGSSAPNRHRLPSTSSGQ